MTIDPSYQEQLDIQKYADQRRQEIHDFLARHKTRLMTLTEVSKAFESQDPYYHGRIFAVLDPQVVASLSYNPIRQVHSTSKITNNRKQWFIDYWEKKYEIDISPDSVDFDEWTYQVCLVFENYSYYNGDYYISVYDYPSCLIATFLLAKEGNDR
ncbi:hypothetical protein CEE45_01440 [Candidatus Heimdallarchaeota archaeon B3_Heim]|nr:MAG: hypothetical protein CEE45_01440 [Candidatus Heimdallarchaeota archaeon B3_Heim]